MPEKSSAPKSLTFGNLELYSIETGRFRLDGGAMFGVVPKTLWNRKIECDEKNRILMATRCLLVRSKSTGRLYLIDNGCGDKFDDKMNQIYSLNFKHSELERSLSAVGVAPSDITDMVFTHLHFDHCGGTTTYDEQGNLKHRFMNATYHVNKRHWHAATNPNAREKASFFDENINPIGESERLNLVDDNHTFEDGFTTITMNGHTIGQQLPFFHDTDKTIVYGADLLPTHAHVPLPWVMGYDMFPLQTLQEKEPFLKEAVEKQWFVYLEHDAYNEVITIKQKDGKYSADQSLTLKDLL
ncbi:MAG TPA: MBL fold metallo-hydrolase [Balneolaceae bacterium]|nr:MBL fold metallo-hydrolase [Balneolaceae bacterium]